MSSPVSSVMTRMWCSRIRTRTWVSAWAQPRPMWWSRLLWVDPDVGPAAVPDWSVRLPLGFLQRLLDQLAHPDQAVTGPDGVMVAGHHVLGEVAGHLLPAQVLRRGGGRHDVDDRAVVRFGHLEGEQRLDMRS